MSEFNFNIKLIVQQCYVCGAVFAISESFEKSRRDDGKEFYCPNRHSLNWEGFQSRAELKQQLDAAENHAAVLSSNKATLLGRLDRAEAALAEHGLLKEKVEAPPAPPPAPREENPQDEAA